MNNILQAIETEFVDKGLRCFVDGSKLFIEGIPSSVCVKLDDIKLSVVKYLWRHGDIEKEKMSAVAELHDPDGFAAFIKTVTEEVTN